MRPNLRIFDAHAFTRIPAEFHHLGPPSSWAEMTRPGKQMHSFLEGPVFTEDGSLWVADVPYGRIFRVHQDGNWDLAFSYDGEPHSLRPMSDGRFAIVDYSKGLLALDPDNGNLEVLAAEDGRGPFLGLSDVTVSAQGDIWFTDSGRSSLSDPRGRLYRRRPDGKLERVLETIPYPNGLAISPEGALLYLAVTRANAVWRLKTERVPLSASTTTSVPFLSNATLVVERPSGVRISTTASPRGSKTKALPACACARARKPSAEMAKPSGPRPPESWM